MMGTLLKICTFRIDISSHMTYTTLILVLNIYNRLGAMITVLLAFYMQSDEYMWTNAKMPPNLGSYKSLSQFSFFANSDMCFFQDNFEAYIHIEICSFLRTQLKRWLVYITFASPSQGFKMSQNIIFASMTKYLEV